MPNLSTFSEVQSNVGKSRSTMDINFRHLTSANFGRCVPFYCMEVVPGDTFDVTTNMFARMSTPLYPVMDDANVTYAYFFVPMRLIWSRWAEFLGENKYTAWVQDTEYIIPHFPVVPQPGDVYDHLEIPTYDPTLSASFGLSSPPEVDINILPVRAFWLIWNEWFRNENVSDPVLVNTGDDVTAAEVNRYRELPHSAKPFDVFTSCLPAPQKGVAAAIGLPDVPVATSMQLHPFVEQANGGTSAIPMVFHSTTGSGNKMNGPLIGTRYANGTNYAYSVGVTGIDTTTNPGAESSVGLMAPSNLWAKTSEANITVNELRQAFAMQRLLELQARSGTRLTEIIKASFGVQSPDARLQRPEYLGGSVYDLVMQQIVQSSSTVSESPLGKVGAFSKTISSHKDFVHSFTEHGYVIGVMTARHKHSYQQGLAPMWSRRGRFDFYWPNFAHIGEQPVPKKCLYYTGNPELDDQPFGYQEAWFDYRYKPNAITGAFRSTVRNNLDEWHYGDVYDEAPTLSEDWMNATDVAVDRTLAVKSTLHDQLIFDIQVKNVATRVIPLFSTPGLIDHF